MLLQRHDHRVAASGYVLELQFADVCTVPVASGVMRSVQTHVGGDVQVRIVYAVEAQIAGRSEGKILALPVRSAVRGVKQVALRDGPNLRAIQSGFELSRWLFQGCIGAGVFPADAVVFRNQDSASGGRKPSFFTEGHVVNLHGNEGGWFLGSGASCRSGRGGFYWGAFLAFGRCRF